METREKTEKKFFTLAIIKCLLIAGLIKENQIDK